MRRLTKIILTARRRPHLWSPAHRMTTTALARASRLQRTGRGAVRSTLLRLCAPKSGWRQAGSNHFERTLAVMRPRTMYSILLGASHGRWLVACSYDPRNCNSDLRALSTAFCQCKASGARDALIDDSTLKSNRRTVKESGLWNWVPIQRSPGLVQWKRSGSRKGPRHGNYVTSPQ